MAADVPTILTTIMAFRRGGRAWTSAVGQASVGPPTGYLPDVVDCARYGDRITVIEADTITGPGSLHNFLITA